MMPARPPIQGATMGAPKQPPAPVGAAMFGGGPPGGMPPPAPVGGGMFGGGLAGALRAGVGAARPMLTGASPWGGAAIPTQQGMAQANAAAMQAQGAMGAQAAPPTAPMGMARVPIPVGRAGAFSAAMRR